MPSPESSPLIYFSLFLTQEILKNSQICRTNEENEISEGEAGNQAETLAISAFLL